MPGWDLRVPKYLYIIDRAENTEYRRENKGWKPSEYYSFREDSLQQLSYPKVNTILKPFQLNAFKAYKSTRCFVLSGLSF